jgi:hypothetical protein
MTAHQMGTVLDKASGITAAVELNQHLTSRMIPVNVMKALTFAAAS